MFRRFVMTAAIAAVFALSSSALLSQQPAPSGAPPQAHGQPMPMPKPVNLKVLPKDTSPDELMKVMRGFTQQLGVHCGFCHAVDASTHRPDFASDAKPDKNTARTMMLMTSEINAKYLSQIHDPDAMPDQKTVSCGTCHQGHSMPIPFKAPTRAGAEHPGMDHPDSSPKQ
jgi:thioredoxin reductase